MTKNTVFIFFLLFLNFSAIAQEAKLKDTTNINSSNQEFKFKKVIIPATLIGFGAIGLNNGSIQKWNYKIRENVNNENFKPTTIDDYIQYAPAFSVYALNNIGIPGKNNLKDRSIILGTSMLLVCTTVTTVKNLSKIERPDGSSANSFPSGHTSLAFAGAEFLNQEYKNVSIWYGITGYTVASLTGALRIYNNRHWFTDVVAGAGVGILCTKSAYWLLPYFKNHIFKSKSKNSTSFLTPYYERNQIGVYYSMNF